MPIIQVHVLEEKFLTVKPDGTESDFIAAIPDFEARLAGIEISNPVWSTCVGAKVIENVEKKIGNTSYRLQCAEINDKKKDRIFFITHKNHFIVLGGMFNHDYHEHPLMKPIPLPEETEKAVLKIIDGIESTKATEQTKEEPTLPPEESHPPSKKPILSADQNNILKATQGSNVLVLGAGGTGKSTIAVEWVNEHSEYVNVLCLTPESAVRDHLQLQFSFPERVTNITWTELEAHIRAKCEAANIDLNLPVTKKSPSDRAYFKQWLEEKIKKIPDRFYLEKKKLEELRKSVDIYNEITEVIIQPDPQDLSKPHLTKEEYLSKGHPKAAEIYALFEEYKSHLEDPSSPCFEPHLRMHAIFYRLLEEKKARETMSTDDDTTPITFEDFFNIDKVCIDEFQRAHAWYLRLAALLLKNGHSANSYFSGDPCQITAHNEGNICEKLNALGMHYELFILTKIFRCPLSVQRAAQRLLILKQKLFGSLTKVNAATARFLIETTILTADNIFDVIPYEAALDEKYNSDDTIVIIPNEMKIDAVKNIFFSGTVFHVSDAIGLERKRVILFGFETTYKPQYDAVNEFMREEGVPELDSLPDYARAKDKTLDYATENALNEFYTAITRSNDVVLVVHASDSPFHFAQTLLSDIPRKTSTNDVILPSNPLKWFKRVKEYLPSSNPALKKEGQAILKSEKIWGKNCALALQWLANITDENTVLHKIEDWLKLKDDQKIAEKIQENIDALRLAHSSSSSTTTTSTVSAASTLTPDEQNLWEQLCATKNAAILLRKDFWGGKGNLELAKTWIKAKLNKDKKDITEQDISIEQLTILKNELNELHAELKRVEQNPEEIIVTKKQWLQSKIDQLEKQKTPQEKTPTKKAVLTDAQKLALNKRLCTAVTQGRLNEVEDLLKQEIDINFKDNEENTLLIIAIKKNHAAIVEALLKKNADPNIPDKLGLTPLHHAIGKKNIAIMKVLFAAKADINFSLNNGPTPLMFALIKHHSECAKLLLENDANPNKGDKEGFTPLFIAVQNDNVEMVKILIEIVATVDPITMEGSTPLHLAAINGNLEIAKLLVDKKASLEAMDKEEKITALFRTVISGRFELMKFLLENGADINTVDNKGTSLLHAAVSKGDFETVKYLVDVKKMDINRINNLGTTPLICAVESGDLDVIQFLIDHHAKVDIQARDGITALHIAVLKKNVEVVKCLVEKGNANPDLVNNQEYTSLHFAAQKSTLEIARVLIEKGKANVNASTSEGGTPLHAAADADNLEVLKYLITVGANVNALFTMVTTTTEETVKPVDLAKKKNHTRIVNYLENLSTNPAAFQFAGSATPSPLAAQPAPQVQQAPLKPELA